MECLNWRKSKKSSPNGENCVELARLPHEIAVRDSKDPDGPWLTFSRGALRAFATEIKSR